MNRTNQTGGCKFRILQVKKTEWLLVSGARLLTASHSAKTTDEGWWQEGGVRVGAVRSGSLVIISNSVAGNTNSL